MKISEFKIGQALIPSNCEDLGIPVGPHFLVSLNANGTATLRQVYGEQKVSEVPADMNAGSVQVEPIGWPGRRKTPVIPDAITDATKLS